MSDIVERLRVTTLWRHSTPPSQELEETDLGVEAAAEIERLLSVCKDKTALLEDAYAQNERLKRAEIAWHLAEAESKRLKVHNTEAAAFLEGLAVLLSSAGLNRSINQQAAADCRAMAAKLREGK